MAAQQNQINLGKELPPFLYYSQVYLRSLPNQLMEQQNILNICCGCQEMGAC